MNKQIGGRLMIVLNDTHRDRGFFYILQKQSEFFKSAHTQTSASYFWRHILIRRSIKIDQGEMLK